MFLAIPYYHSEPKLRISFGNYVLRRIKTCCFLSFIDCLQYVMFIYLVTKLTHCSWKSQKNQSFFNLGLLLIKSLFCSSPEMDKFLNEIIDYGSQWQLLVLSPYYSIQCCLKVFVSICCFTANKALRHSQYQKNTIYKSIIMI